MTDKSGFWAWAKTMPGAMILTGVLVLIAVGALRVSDLTGKQPTQEIPIANEGLRLLIKDSANEAAKQTVKQYDEVWSQWRKSTEDRLSALERDRWIASRRRNTTEQ